jgi:SEC-C motif-containing protein
MAGKAKAAICWCDSGQLADDCCASILSEQTRATTALSLMRSRYSAFVTLNESYLAASWHPRTRPKVIHLDPEQRWLGLKIVNFTAGDADDADGTVEFVARYKVAGRGTRLHENSRFEQIDGHWYYTDGDRL